jgi:hypothetical protein
MDCVEVLYTGNHFMFFLSNLDMISIHGEGEGVEPEGSKLNFLKDKF